MIHTVKYKLQILRNTLTISIKQEKSMQLSHTTLKKILLNHHYIFIPLKKICKSFYLTKRVFEFKNLFSVSYH